MRKDNSKTRRFEKNRNSDILLLHFREMSLFLDQIQKAIKNLFQIALIEPPSPEEEEGSANDNGLSGGPERNPHEPRGVDARSDEIFLKISGLIGGHGFLDDLVSPAAHNVIGHEQGQDQGDKAIEQRKPQSEPDEDPEAPEGVGDEEAKTHRDGDVHQADDEEDAHRR